MRSLINKTLLIIIGTIGYLCSSYACHKQEQKNSCTKSESTIKTGKTNDFSCMYGVPKSDFEPLDSTNTTKKPNNKKEVGKKAQKQKVTKK